MKSFINKMEVYIRQQHLIGEGESVLVGFSGGADSTSLLYALICLQEKLKLTLYAAHVNYNLRGEDSIADRKFVINFCRQHSIPFEVRDISIVKSGNLEDNARRIRFDFFNELSEKLPIDKIALGHNTEDCVETILIHLFRGSGISGMRGILPQNGNIIRPLLCFARAEIVSFLEEEGIEWREDRTNQETDFTRNKIRNVLLPYISKEINPNIINTLYKNSFIFQYADEYLVKEGSKAFNDALKSRSETSFQFDLISLQKQEPAVVFYLLKETLKELTNDEYALSGTNFQDLEKLLDKEGCKEITLANNIIIRKDYDSLTVIKKITAAHLEQDSKKTAKKIQLGKKELTIGNAILTWEVLDNFDMTQISKADNQTAYIDLDSIAFPLRAGFREDGDWFVPLGMRGKKKLKDYFIDEKIGKYIRDDVVIVRDKEKIVWVAGHRLDDRVKVTEKTKKVLLMKQERK